MTLPSLWEAIRAGACPSIDALTAALAPAIPLLRALRDTPQDAEWHAEGDVYVHTGMVLDALYALLARGELGAVSPDERLTWVLGALLHDIAKPLTTRPAEIQGRQRVAAPQHEAKGRSYLAPRLAGLGLPPRVATGVLGLVGSHHEPKRLVVKDRPLWEARAVARRADPRGLVAVELADMRGRICPDQAAQLEIVALYEMLAADAGGAGWEEPFRALFTACFAAHPRPDAAQRRAFGEALLRAQEGALSSAEEAQFLTRAGPDDPPELVILVGPSGAGKSTFVERALQHEPHRHAVVSLDALREQLGAGRGDQSKNGEVRQAAREALKGHLRAGRRVVWDATNLRRDFRAPLVQLGRDYGALVTMVTFLDTPEGYARRNQRRPAGRTAQHEGARAVPQRVLDDQLDGWEWPEPDEAHQGIVLTPEGQVASASGVLGALPYGLAWAPGAA